MICLKCNGSDFRPAVRAVPQEVKGKTVEVFTEILMCEDCHFIQLTDKQATTLLKKVRKDV